MGGMEDLNGNWKLCQVHTFTYSGAEWDENV